ncbi:MAG: HEAT repeat domain-containing protein [Nitrospirae bacterium]|nr:HEAT repeat domain-containing protein [Nitrospirota bacterium]
MAKNIKKLIQKLSNADPSVRRFAAEELSEADERAIYPLIKCLNDDNAGVQDAAMRSLIFIGGEATAYMVLPLMRENTLLRNTALIILRDLGEISVPLLYSLLRDKDEDVRKFAIDLLGEIKTGVDASKLLPSFKDPNANARAAVAKAVGLLEYRDALPSLIAALDDEEWVAFSALESLGLLKAEESVESIAALLEKGSEALRFVAIETLGQIGSAKGVDVLRSYLAKASDDEKNAVIKSLIQIGITPDMSEISCHLLPMLKEGDWDDREVVLKGIVGLNCTEAVPLLVDIAGSLDSSMPGNEERLNNVRNTLTSINSEDELIKLLDSTDLRYRGKAFAIEILGETKSKKSVSRLLNYLNDMRRDLRRASAEALGEIQDPDPDAIKGLLDASHQDVDSHVRRTSIDALGNIKSKAAVKPLLELMEVERYRDVLERIVKALLNIDAESFLANIGGYNETVKEIIADTVSDLDVLLKLSEDNSKKVKSAAIHSLGKVGTAAALLKLSSFLSDSDSDIRRAAVVGLGEAGYCSQDLINALHDSDPWVRFYTIKSVGFSCDRERSIELIRDMLDDEFIPVVMSAIDAIMNLGGREAYEVLSAHEEHPNPDVRDKIREALNNI